MNERDLSCAWQTVKVVEAWKLRHPLHTARLWPRLTENLQDITVRIRKEKSQNRQQ